MAEAVGLAASVIAIIQFTAKVSSLCIKYYSGVKNAVNDIELLQHGVDGLSTTLKRVQQLLDSPNGGKLKASQDLHGAIADCHRQLAELVSKLEPGRTHKAISFVGIRAL